MSLPSIRLWFAVLTLALLTPSVSVASKTAIETGRRALATANISEADRAKAAADLDAAMIDEETTDELAEQIARLRAEAARLPARTHELRRALTMDQERALVTWAARLPRQADAETLERLLNQERTSLAAINEEIETAGAQLAEVLSGTPHSTSDIVLLGQQIEALAAPITPAKDEPKVVLEARRIAQASERRRLSAELELENLKQDTAVARQQLLELSLSELKARRALHLARMEALQRDIASLGRRDIDALVERLETRADEFAAAAGLVARVRDENKALGAELLNENTALSADRSQLSLIESARDSGAAALRESRARLELGARNEQVGRWLWSERRQIATPTALSEALDATRNALGTTRLRLFNLSAESRLLLDLPGAVASLTLEYAAENEDEGSASPVDPAALTVLLRDRAEILSRLQPLFERRISALEQSEAALVAQTATAAELRQLLDRHLLWIASHAPVDTAWVARLPAGFRDLLKPSRYLTLSNRVVAELKTNPVRWALAIAALLALFVLRRQAPDRIRAEASITRLGNQDNLGATARALLWTLIGAAPLVGALALTGVLLLASGETGRFTDSTGQAVLGLIVPTSGFLLLHWVVMEQGLGHAHFRWVRSRRETLRTVLPILSAIVLPSYFLALLAFFRNVELSNDVEARITIVIATVTIAAVLWYALAPRRVWAARGLDPEPSRARIFLRCALPLGALTIVALAVRGYVYSAGILLQSVLATITMCVVLSVLFGLIGRWLVIGEKRLRLREADSRDAVRIGTTTDGAPEVTLDMINQQTGRLLRALRYSVFAMAIAWAWMDLMPAFARLDEVVLWSLSETAADGTATDVPVTLKALLLGLIALTLTVIGARNLPGLVEILLTSRTHVDAATRYAITSVLRYAIVIVGMIIGLGMLGMRWSQLQWLAAALTVGLGFGLQEIFANFVSGLILLFERPFRVGDIITIGDLTGRVTRIRTRATSLADFDNKEIVVPNKNFITGQLVNWTLSDTVTRITIKVGVDYGTPPKQVLDLLLQAAREHALVMQEPAPQSWFVAFGANSLDFELRVFVDSIDHRLLVQNDLNIRIADLFAEHGVNMAFPQLDVHIRHLPGTPPAPAAS
ncbi:MAG: mechanosensitive ion channel domain-containing protein [Pseudomonadales bacterium]